MANKFHVTSMVLFLILAILGRLMVSTMNTGKLSGVIITFLYGSSMVTCLSMGVIFLFLAHQPVSEHHTVTSALWHVIVTYYTLWIGKKTIKALRKSFPNPRQAQENVLKKIIQANKNTAYGVKFHLGNIRSLSDFKSAYPLTKYDDYESYIQRVAKGEKNVMTTRPINRLVLTSGTTGKGKLIPRDMSILTTLFGVVNVIQSECFPKVKPLQKIFRLHCNSKSMKSECGVTITATAVVERESAGFMPMFSTPPDGWIIESINEAFYIHFLFALRERRLGSAMATFSSMILDGFNYFEKHWPSMVNDIANGTINKGLNLSPHIRKNLEKAMRPGDVRRAEEVRKECEKGQQGIIKRLWPSMEYVTVIDNIGIRNTLMKTVGKGLLFYSPVFGTSEAEVGFNLSPQSKGDEEYVMIVTNVVYEFIPEDDIDKPDPKTYFIDEVEIGKNYELVVSQIYGLYRYRLGDVVQITGYHENTPKVKFLYRTATLLNLFGEKVDQPTVITAIKTALTHFPNLELKHYSVAESTITPELADKSDVVEKQSHYIFFLELEADKEIVPLQVDTDQMAELIDETMYNDHRFYRTLRDMKGIDVCKVYLVKTGAFQELKEFILANTSATESQFKMPQKLRTAEMVKIMLENRIK